MTIGLIIFDCDGVLVDSEVISCRVFAESLTRHGYPITAEEVSVRFLGRSVRDAYVEIEHDLGHALPDDFEQQRKAEILAALAVSLAPISGIHAALAVLAIPVCVASSGFPQKIVQSLTVTNLHDHFAPHIFSASQVARGKPAPDLFLYAAAQMGVAPANCLVIEDSVAGVTAGLAAGMTVLGFSGGSHCRPGHAGVLLALGAHAVFGDMAELPDLIEKYGNSGVRVPLAVTR